MKTELSTEEELLFEQLFHAIFQKEFPEFSGDLSRILYAAKLAVRGKGDREFLRLTRLFFEENAIQWPRYEAYLDYWGRPEDQSEEDDEFVGGPDTHEMADLLTHRILMAHINSQKRLQYEQDADTFPYWRLWVIEDGRAYPECLEESKEPRHYTTPYWQNKKLPCDRLFCRCSISRSATPSPPSFPP